MNQETYNKLQLKSERYADSATDVTIDGAFRDGAYWYNEQYGWKNINEVKPPVNTLILFKILYMGGYIAISDGVYDDKLGIKIFNPNYNTQEAIKGCTIEWINIPD